MAERAARGETAMDEKGRESGHLMLITPERVLYAGCSAARASVARARFTFTSRSRAIFG
jgi:hypothetical protein